MAPERLVVVPMLVVAVALLRVAPTPGLGIIALLATLAAFPLAARFAPTRNEQGMVGVAALSIGILLPRALAPDSLPAGAISDGMYALGLAAQLAGVVRLFIRDPAYGAPITCALGLVALTAAGRSSIARDFPLYIAMFLLSSAAAVARADRGWPRLRDLGARHLIAGLLAISIASGVVALAAAQLPPLQAQLIARLMRGWKQPRTGFTETLSLGGMRGMALSDELVARVRGAPVDHLRGVVFRTYSGGTWKKREELPRTLLELETPPPLGERAVEIELPGRLPTIPAPLGAVELWSSTSVLEVEKQGVLRPVEKHRPKRVAFRLDPAVGAPGGVADPPDEIDGQLAPATRAALVAILARWGSEGKTPRQTVDLIRARLLADYGYSLEFDRDTRSDPVIEFLTQEGRGHCEYFASAAALLARAAGLPSRVVGGYRVSERSPIADYALVRERDAHAWAEVWLDGRWETLDATPGGPIGARSVTPWTTALADLIATSWETVDDWLGRRSQLELSGALVSLMVAFVAYRAWRARGAASGPMVVDRPLPGFVRLSRALERAGVAPRGASEPVEAFARRVGEAPLEVAVAAAAQRALAEYAALRYGAPRDEEAVLGGLAEAAASVERLPRAR